METNKIIQDDCLKALKDIPNQIIDFIIADFPYNISNYGNSLTKRGNQIVKGDFGEWDKWDSLEDYFDWCYQVLKELMRVLKKEHSAVCFFDNRLAGFIAAQGEFNRLFVYKAPLIWVKNNPIPHIRKSGFRSTFEHGVWLINSQERYLGNEQITIKAKVFNFQEQEEMMNVMRYNIGQNLTEHPTEKPLNLTQRLVKIFTNLGDIVLDPFCGSGTSLLAAETLERKWIGIEINPDYCKMTQERIDNYKRQQKLL